MKYSDGPKNSKRSEKCVVGSSPQHDNVFTVTSRLITTTVLILNIHCVYVCRGSEETSEEPCCRPHEALLCELGETPSPEGQALHISTHVSSAASFARGAAFFTVVAI